MKPIYWIFAVVLGVGLVAAWQYSQRPDAAESRAAAHAPDATAAPVSARAPAATSTPSQPEATSADLVTQWIADVDSTDAARRTIAIRALAHAPRAQALPVLQRLVMNADPADRPVALASLRDLALEQGDADNAARQAMRQVIYHGDDEQLAAGAQDALDAVENAQRK